MGATVKDLFTQLYDLSPPELDILFMLINRQDGEQEPMTRTDIKSDG